MDEASLEIFTIKARRCKRCGGLLTSEQAVRDGYGHTCKIKMHREEAAREQLKDQLSLFPSDPDDTEESL